MKAAPAIAGTSLEEQGSYSRVIAKCSRNFVNVSVADVLRNVRDAVYETDFGG